MKQVFGILGVLSLSLILAAPAPVSAQGRRGRRKAAPKVAPTASELIAEAKILFDNDELSAAEDRLEKAVVAPTLDRLNSTEELDLWTYLAVIRLRLGNSKGATDAFRKAIEIKPTHQVSRRLASVKVMQFFERFRERELRATRASIKHTPPSRFAFGTPIELSAYVVDRTGTVVKVSVYFREKGTTNDFSSTFLSVDPADTTHFEGVVPYLFGDKVNPFEVEYYLAAVTASDEWVATSGSVRTPLFFEVEGGRAPEKVSDKPKLYSRWWFWTGIGVLVAGGTAGGLYGYSASRTPPGTGGALVVIR